MAEHWRVSVVRDELNTVVCTRRLLLAEFDSVIRIRSPVPSFAARNTTIVTRSLLSHVRTHTL